MDTEAFQKSLDDFDTTVESLEAALTPLLSQPLSTLTTKLPLLERAKVYTLTNYAILSLIFSTLKLNDVDAKAHPVFAELTRCKEYFEKIENAKTAHIQKEDKKKDERRLRVDKEAAARFVKAGIHTNDSHTAERIGGEGAQNSKSRRAKRKIEEVEPVEMPTKNVNESDSEEVEVGTGRLLCEPTKSKRRKGKKLKKNHKSHDAPKSSNQAMQKLMSKSGKQAKDTKAS